MQPTLARSKQSPSRMSRSSCARSTLGRPREVTVGGTSSPGGCLCSCAVFSGYFQCISLHRMCTCCFQEVKCCSSVQVWRSLPGNRLQACVPIANRLSSSLESRTGAVYQLQNRRVLGPLLFVLYTRSLHDILPRSICHQEFADDIIIDTSHPDPHVVTAELSEGITCLADWLEDRGLLLNQGKTQVMFIKPRGVMVVPGIVNCRGAPLVNVLTVKYLGVLIDDDLRWVSHIQHMAVKCRQAIERLWRHRQCLNHAARRMWYVAMVQSKLCYGSNAMFPSLLERSKATTSKLSKASVRAVFGLHNPISTQPLLNELHVSEIMDIMLRKVLVFVYRCLNAHASFLFTHYYTPIASLTDGNHRLTRGQEARLLSVPFFPDPAGRASIQFSGAIGWNLLCPATRMSPSVNIFKALIKSIRT